MANLRIERVRGKAILVGNVMIDTVIANLDRVSSSSVGTRFGLKGGKYAVATFHRPSNVDSKDSAGTVVGALGITCLTMRVNSERPSTISIGTSLLIGSDLERLKSQLENVSAGTFKGGSVPERAQRIPLTGGDLAVHK
jgi:UDP-N-acetylglucosamine 2-epimerase